MTVSNHFKDAREKTVAVGMSVVFSHIFPGDNFSTTKMAWGVVTKLNNVMIHIKTDDGTVVSKAPHNVVVASLPMVAPQ